MKTKRDWTPHPKKSNLTFHLLTNGRLLLERPLDGDTARNALTLALPSVQV